MEKIQVPQDNCPTAPPQRMTVHTRVLHRACQKLGGIEQLAEALHVPVETLYRWLEGEDVPPSRIFLKAVDLVMPAWGPDDDAHAQSIRRKKN
jgi:hypothetical protein